MPTAEKDTLLALVGEPIQAHPEVWTLSQWWEWHGRLVRALIDDDTYVCPTTGETESRTMGGFDVCCDHPECPGSTRPIPPEECPNADLHETFAGMECGRCGTVIPPGGDHDAGEGDAYA
jgi:hypothetical protein